MKNKKQKVGDLGQHWTPRDVAQMMIKLKKNKGITLEPSAGSGRFVEILGDNVVAVEIDKSVVPNNLKDRYVISNFLIYQRRKNLKPLLVTHHM